MISRRAFIALVGGGLIARSSRVDGQPALSRIAYIGGRGKGSPQYTAFLEGLRELDYIGDSNVAIEVRVSETAEGFDQFAAEVTAKHVNAIFASNPYALGALIPLTKTIPIVGVDLESDPIAKGWAASLARPGGNVTGLFLDVPELSAKHLQLLKEVKPDLTRVAVLGDRRINDLQFRATAAAASALGLTLYIPSFAGASDVSPAIAEAARQRCGALVVLSSPLVLNSVESIANAALKHRLPAICLFVPAFTDAGGLIAYGPEFIDLFRRAGNYVGRILKGAKAGDLPIQRPAKFELAVNLKTARTIGISLPQSLLLRADHVIR